jgi:hypothetical protein
MIRGLAGSPVQMSEPIDSNLPLPWDIDWDEQRVT